MLEGSVRKAGSKVRITGQLIDAAIIALALALPEREQYGVWAPWPATIISCESSFA